MEFLLLVNTLLLGFIAHRLRTKGQKGPEFDPNYPAFSKESIEGAGHSLGRTRASRANQNFSKIIWEDASKQDAASRYTPSYQVQSFFKEMVRLRDLEEEQLQDFHALIEGNYAVINGAKIADVKDTYIKKYSKIPDFKAQSREVDEILSGLAKMTAGEVVRKYEPKELS